MIIFYNKETGEIYGTVSGRVHDEQVLKNVLICPSNISLNTVQKYVVPFKETKKVIDEPVEELVVKPGSPPKVIKEVTGFRKREVVDQFLPDCPFNDLFYLLESGRERIYDYRVKVDKNGGLVDLIKKKK